MNKDKFNVLMDEVLLRNNFSYYDDWKYGPQSAWSIDCEHFTMKLMRHDFGYWIILDAHASGERKQMNIGSSNSAQDIILARDSLSKFF